MAAFAGIFAIACAALDVKWFMNDHKAKHLIKMFGYNGARLFYVISGLIITLGSFYMFINSH